MTKEQFIEELKGYLSVLPKEELESAVKYYEEYLEESEDADDAIKSLGSAKNVADQILSDMGRVETSSTENIPVVTTNQTEENTKKKKEKKGLTALETVLIIILCVITSPLWITLAVAAFAIAFAIIVTVLTLLLAIALASLVVGVAGILGFVVSFGVLSSADFATAFTLMGVSLFMIAIGALLAIPGWAIILKVVPAFFRGLVKLFKKIFRIK